ncbi:CASP-like protein 5B2 [Gossypium australe]|uniref:CASP-like protein n=1 Tax=Gossypium australe TaxID=47621 RepID=A0A5B6V476_9ROSI|nr:CASP-like protein 5B2 [Gossypium australe]
MKELIGSPGTVSGLTLRVTQCAFAAASIALMVSASEMHFNCIFCTFDVYNALCFSYLIASMGLQLLWSFGLACLDVFALRRKRDLQNPVLVSLFVVGDWVTAMLSLAAACSSAGIIVLYARDLDFCKAQSHIPCRQFEISIILAFITWLLIAMSSHVMFWILASF